MLTLEIDNKEIEKNLLSKFKTESEIKKYFFKLLEDDMEDTKFSTILHESNKHDFVSKEDVFQELDKIL